MPPRLRCALFLLLAAIVISGCATKISRPPYFVTAGLSEPGQPPPHTEDAKPTVTVFYATTREPKADGSKGARYGDGRTYETRLGVARVRLGAKDWASAREQVIEGDRPEVSLAFAEEIGLLPSTVVTDPPYREGRTYAEVPGPHEVGRGAADWAQRINEALASSPRKHLTVYVHGATATFESPLTQIAGIGYYFGDSVGVAYCWPVGSSAFGYFRSGDRARGATRGFREMMRFLAEHTDAEKINVVSYSAGGQIVTRGLSALRQMHGDIDREALPAKTKIGAVVLAGSEEDVPTTVEYLLDEVDAVCEQITVYVSGIDDTMSLAWIATLGRETVGGRGRLSQSLRGEELREARKEGVLRLHTIDATSAQNRRGAGVFGHSYWKDNPWVTTDLMLQFRYGLKPWERGLVYAAKPEDAAWWVFPKDYEDRLKSDVLPGLPSGP